MSGYMEAKRCKCGCKEQYVMDFWLLFGLQTLYKYNTRPYTWYNFIEDAPTLFLTSTAIASYKFRVENAERQCKEDLLCLAQGMIFDPAAILKFV